MDHNMALSHFRCKGVLPFPSRAVWLLLEWSYWKWLVTWLALLFLTDYDWLWLVMAVWPFVSQCACEVGTMGFLSNRCFPFPPGPYSLFLPRFWLGPDLFLVKIIILAMICDLYPRDLSLKGTFKNLSKHITHPPTSPNLVGTWNEEFVE
jgi:hypothetical protein